MRRYLPPALLMAAAPLLMGSTGWILLSVLAYIVGGVWWTGLAARSRAALLVRLVLAWVPAIAPLVWIVDIMRAMERDDTAALAGVIAIWPAVATVLASLAASGFILLRAAGGDAREP